jgi:hypothetical protein
MSSARNIAGGLAVRLEALTQVDFFPIDRNKGHEHV